ncbi:MAG: exodeoxyribonuclease VII large subunit [Micrococcaceae bacterium]
MKSQLPPTATETSAENPWPVSVFSQKLKMHIERAPQTWIEGEILQFNKRRGTSFVTLKDLNADATAQLTVWANVMTNVSVPLQEGNRVVALVKPNYWIAGGRLSMSTLAIKPVGEGELLLRIEQLKNKLAAEGLFALNHKKPLPFLPNRIGLVTGRDSDALKDVLKNAKLRWPAVEFEIREVAVQGKNAVPEVIAGIKDLDQLPEIDVIIVARGGGSVEDLMPFNDEEMVRTIFACKTPVVSAIGHEANRPIIDEVADLRASTPTDAAKRTVPDIQEQQAIINESQERLLNYMQSYYLRESAMLQSYLNRPVLKNPLTDIELKQTDINTLQNRALQAIKSAYLHEKTYIDAQGNQLRALSPQHILDRGYALIRDENTNVIHSVSDTKIGEQLLITMADGALETEVKTIIGEDTDD